MICDGQCNLNKAKKWCKNDWWKGEKNKLN